MPHSLFNKNNVIEDAYVLGYDSKFDVQKFLEKWDSCLADYVVNGLHASRIIKEACQPLDIDTRIILLNLQKEQSLISRKVLPSQRTLDRCLGFGMTDGGDRKEFYGFEKQIESAAHWWKEKMATAQSKVGKPFKCSDGVVVPENRATYCAYVYTPHQGTETRIVNGIKYEAPFGNYLLWRIKRKFFES